MFIDDENVLTTDRNYNKHTGFVFNQMNRPIPATCGNPVVTKKQEKNWNMPMVIKDKKVVTIQELQDVRATRNFSAAKVRREPVCEESTNCNI